MLILIADAFDKSLPEKLSIFGEVTTDIERLGEADVVLIRSKTKATKDYIDKAKNMKLIIRGGVGMDNIDIPYCKEKGIVATNTPRSSAIAVAELAFCLMLSTPNNLCFYDSTMKNGEWAKKTKRHELYGKTLCLLGIGNIARKVAERAHAFGMKVVAYDIFKIPELENENMRYAEMDELFEVSDFISLHTPSIDGRPLINAETIAKMKNGVVIINTSRGNNVDEQALLDALNSGKVFGAGLDVFAEEPAKNVELYSHPRVSCTPHIGASTSEAQKRIGAEIVDIITKF